MRLSEVSLFFIFFGVYALGTTIFAKVDFESSIPYVLIISCFPAILPLVLSRDIVATGDYISQLPADVKKIISNGEFVPCVDLSAQGCRLSSKNDGLDHSLYTYGEIMRIINYVKYKQKEQDRKLNEDKNTEAEQQQLLQLKIEQKKAVGQ